MACTVRRPVQVEVAVNTEGQTREKVIELVDALLRQNGAIECGIMGFFSIALGGDSSGKLGSDPGPDLKKLGVTSLRTARSS